MALVLPYPLAVVKVDDPAEDEQGAQRGFSKRESSSCYRVLLKIFPLTSIKIVVVVWQILDQVNLVLANGKYST